MGGSERIGSDREAGAGGPLTAQAPAPAGASTRRSSRTPARPLAVQAKLVVGPADDPFEREADEMARHVASRLSAPAGPIGDASEDVGPVAMASRIRRAVAADAATADAPIGAAGGAVGADVESRIRSARAGGAPLPGDVGSRMEQAFGTDFGDVRVHSGAQSADLNRSISARAFTTGSDIFLGAGTPALDSSSGTELLAHELTHVVQQRGGVQRAVIHRAYKNGSADKDAPLFEKAALVDKPIGAANASKLGITQGNMEHYLERHTFKYQKLNAKTVSPGAGMFPVGTTADDVKKWLDEAIDKLPDGTTIGDKPVSTAVDLANGLRVNLGALKGGKLQAFFPIAGGSNAGFHEYTSDELKAIRTAKNGATT